MQFLLRQLQVRQRPTLLQRRVQMVQLLLWSMEQHFGYIHQAMLFHTIQLDLVIHVAMLIQPPALTKVRTTVVEHGMWSLGTNKISQID